MLSPEQSKTRHNQPPLPGTYWAQHCDTMHTREHSFQQKSFRKKLVCGGGKEQIQPWPGQNLNLAEQMVLGTALSLALSTHSAQDTTPRADLQGPQPSQFSWLRRAAVLSPLSTFQCCDCCRMSLTWDTMGFLLGSLSTTMSGSSASGQNPSPLQAHVLVQEVGHKRIPQWSLPLLRDGRWQEGSSVALNHLPE